MENELPKDYRFRKIPAEEVNDQMCCGSRAEGDPFTAKFVEIECSYNIRTRDLKQGAAPDSTIVRRQSRRICLDHARKFAQKHGLEEALDALLSSEVQP